MMRRSRVSSPSSRRPRRKLVWARQLNHTPAAIAAGAVVVIQPLTNFRAGLGADLIGSTIMRTRLTFNVSNAVANHAIMVDMAMGVFPENEATQTPLLSPSVDVHEDWMFWHMIDANPGAATGEFAHPGPYAQEFDIKSKRRLDELQQDLILFVRNAHPTDAVNYAYATSVLIALP